MNKKSIEFIAKSEEDKILLSNIYDKMLYVKDNLYPLCTNFLTETQCEYVKKLFMDKSSLEYILFGGYKDALRKICIILPEYMLKEDFVKDIDNIEDISCIKITPLFKKSLSHRDYLGSIMALNISRNRIGDIIVHDNFAFVIIKKEIEKFIMNNLQKIGSTTVKLEKISLRHIIPAKVNLEFKEKVISSLRLDTYISTVYNLSREKSKKLIENKLVSVNNIVTIKPTTNIEVNSTISLKGYGKTNFVKIISKTKKDNLLISVAYYK